jgi:hypothetical protein
MTPREFADRIIAGEFHFPFEARILEPKDADLGGGWVVARKVEVLDRDGKEVADFETPNAATNFILSTMKLLRLRHDAEKRAN